MKNDDVRAVESPTAPNNNTAASSFVALGSPRMPFDGTYFVHAQSICTIALYSDKYAVET